jgi:hypothetical protein
VSGRRRASLTSARQEEPDDRPSRGAVQGGLDDLVAALISDGYTVIGPTVRDDAIVLDEFTSGAQFPAGWGGCW